MTLKYALKFMAVLCCVITTVIIIFVSVLNLLLSPDASFTPADLLRIFCIAFFSVIPVLLFAGNENASRRKVIFISVLHFLLTAAIVFGLMIYFGFIDYVNAVFVLITFLIIYAGAYAFQEMRDRKLAGQLNKKLNAFHCGKNETYRD